VQERPFGSTGITVSALGFGCGNVGGLMIRGAPAERVQAAARAIELGITYFDTAPSYGNGESERNLGRALAGLGTGPEIRVGTKFRLDQGDLGDVPGAIRRSLDASLARLGRPDVDLFQLHNSIGRATLDPAVVLEQVVPVLEQLAGGGKIRFFGITGNGDTEALHRVIDSGRLQSVQSFFNLLNPSSAYSVPVGYPAQNFEGLIPHAAARGMGVIVVRALAAGALSGDPLRHPLAASGVAPIASGVDYDSDLRRANALRVLVAEGHAGSLVEAALRFPLATPGVSTVLLGMSSLAQLELAAASVENGPLPAEAYARLEQLWAGFAARA
jgi:L-galactose dehydrogenase/L-glyceraldehyde 3-phosphate reductase